MDKGTRSAIERATQRARKLLEDDFASQLEGTFGRCRSPRQEIRCTFPEELLETAKDSLDGYSMRYDEPRLCHWL